MKDETYELGNELLSRMNDGAHNGRMTFNMEVHSTKSIFMKENIYTILVSPVMNYHCHLDAGFLAYKTNPALDSMRLQGKVWANGITWPMKPA
jgi:hypothetical protein